MGNEIDVFTPGDGTLSAGWGFGLLIPRRDQRASGLTSYDGRFGGTSSACPTAAGMIATALQYNRTWGWQNVRSWLQSLTEQSALTFYQGPEPSTATDSAWSDLNSLMGASRRVLYNNITASTSTSTPLVTTLAISSSTLTINQIVTPFTPVTATGGNGVLTWAVNTPFPTGLAFNTGNGTITGTPTAISSASSYTISVNDSTTSSSQVFVLAVLSVQVVTTLVIPNRNLTVLEAVTPFIPVTATGGSGTLAWSINPPLPAGLTFNTSNGQISGTPTVVVTPVSYIISVTDGYTVDSETFTLGSVATPLVTTLAISNKILYCDSVIINFIIINIVKKETYF
jgi:hypothetical protein